MKEEKLNQKTIPQLIDLAAKNFHKFIRERDKNKPCISCGKFTDLECGHFYSAGHYPALRFDEENSHGQCSRCNRFLHGNLLEYRIGLINRYGQEFVEKLETKAAYYKRSGFKWDRFTLIQTIIKYQNHGKNQISSK